MRQFKQMMVMIVLAGSLAACQTLGVAPADTFNKKWAEAQQTDTGVLENALTLAKAGKITPDQLRKVEVQTDNAKSGLDLARQLHSSNSAAAADRVTQIMATLSALQAALESPEVGTALQSALGK